MAIFALVIDQSIVGLSEKIFDSVTTNLLAPNQYLPYLTDFHRHLTDMLSENTIGDLNKVHILISPYGLRHITMPS